MESSDAGAAVGSPPPSGGAVRIETGALEDRGYPLFQLALAVLGWLLAIFFVVVLAADAGEIAVSITVFLVTVIVIVAVTSALVAVELRPPHLRARRQERAPLEAYEPVDALGRPLSTEGARESTGEIAIVEMDGIRRYTRAEGVE